MSRKDADQGKPAKISRRKPTTPRSRVKNALRQVWLRSRERAAALKAASHSCERCGAKGRAKDTRNGPACALEVHHRDGVPNWEAIVDLVFRRLLPAPDRLEVLCKMCHGKEHDDPPCMTPHENHAEPRA